MIPIKLDIQGLYSYQEKQTIDFTQLTAAGIFGIFGAVGSGKSSILEGVLLALYGSTERLSDRGEKNSMVNLQSGQLQIQFEFKAGQNNAQIFIARYTTKRNAKNFDELKPADHTFYEKTSDQLIPISLRAEEIIGMKKEHFKQTVIIPQGKFREFIDLTPGPRAEMMKELFGLERFDLAGKTGKLLKIVKEHKIRLETILNGLSEISEEKLSEKINTFKALSEILKNSEKDFRKTEKAYQHQKDIKEKFQLLQNFQKEWHHLQSSLPEIEHKKQLWKTYHTAKTHLEPVWRQIKEERKEKEKLQVSVINCRRFKDTYTREIEELTREEAELKKTAEERPIREAKIRDLKRVLEAQPLLKAQKEAEQQIEILNPSVKSLNSSIQSIHSKINELEGDSEKLDLPDSSQLSELKSSAKEWESLENQLSKNKETLSVYEKEALQLEREIGEIKSVLPDSYPDFQAWQSAQGEVIRKQEEIRDQLVQNWGLASHASQLRPGEACPLCGAYEHPNPLSPSESGEALEKQDQSIKAEKKRLESIFSHFQNLNEKIIRLEGIQNNISERSQDLDTIRQKVSAIKSHLSEEGIPSIEALKKLVNEADSAITKNQKTLQLIKSLRKKYEEEKSQLESKEKNLHVLEQQVLEYRTKILAKREEITDQEFSSSYFNKDPSSIQNVMQSVLKDIQDTANKLDSKQKVLIDTRARQSTNLANLATYEDLEIKTSNKILELQKKLEGLVAHYDFKSLDKVIALLNDPKDIENADLEIRKFEDRLLIVNSKIKDLESEEGVTHFQLKDFEALLADLVEQQSQLEITRKNFTLLDQEIQSIQSQWQEKQKYTKEFILLENRETYLKELEKLFKGSGFVKYVSTIYLKELCNTANLRFTKLTKNSLSLEIDDNNIFWVTDYLNGGKKRLLKTLSGGQTFQASLCLALALAEKVKSLNQADQSFFFLDEGFGALDRNSLRVVFETLKALRHENRIVGIISHVEELQQEIEVFAKVELDPEHGSQVSYSYQ
ncbi:MAG: SMC family ATPase [Cyclobacteriaceae bacterium]